MTISTKRRLRFRRRQKNICLRFRQKNNAERHIKNKKAVCEPQQRDNCQPIFPLRIIFAFFPKMSASARQKTSRLSFLQKQKTACGLFYGIAPYLFGFTYSDLLARIYLLRFTCSDLLTRFTYLLAAESSGS